MAGAAKKRQVKERHTKKDESSNEKTSASGSSGQSPTQHSPPSRMDGNRDPEAPRERAASNASQSAPGTLVAYRGPPNVIANRNIDFGAAGAALMGGFGAQTNLPKRPAQTNKSGREVSVKLNTYHVVQYPQKPVYQYDIVVGDGQAKRGLIMAIWQNKTVQGKLGQGWIFDGNKLAWSLAKNEGELRIIVDLDADSGKPPRKDKDTGLEKPDKHKVVIRLTKQIDFGSLRAYLERRADWTNPCLEAINFLDHLMRETPTKKYTQIKRNFFARGQTRSLLGQGVEAFKGVYASMRPVNIASGQPGSLSVNVDVANTTFYTEAPLHLSAMSICNARDPNHLAQLLSQSQRGSSPWLSLNRLRKVRVYTTHREPKAEAVKNPWFIESFCTKSAREFEFLKRNEKTGRDEKTTIEQYFRDVYKPLQFPNLPVVQMHKPNVVLPMEVCVILQNQRYPFKLSDKQTMEMIKFAVTLPEVRWKHIEEGVGMLNWGADQYLTNYGLRISPTPTTVKARLLPNPKVRFENKDEDPRTSGRWDLRGKRFAGPHKTPLKSWGVCVVPGRFAAGKDQVSAFMSTFMTTFSGHGGKIANKAPTIMQGTGDPAKDVENLYNAVGNANQAKPELLLFIVPDKNSEVYNRIKKSCDCRYGIVSQVLQSAHVQKNQAQYCSNVAMKVNAKLGGYTAQAKGTHKGFTRPTMIIGADVSHGAPGGEASSIASMTLSWDRECIRYCGAVQTNGQRVEMITKDNIDSMLTPLVNQWIIGVGGGRFPEHLIYLRDGVSEGQYAAVINQEVHDLRGMLKQISPKMQTKLTVVVASKRHHVRFFPDKTSGDRNGNPQPGTLVESGVTHPFEYDFYLCAHSAIKGTARPVHYHVLLDEAKMGVEELQNMIYEHSYQYVRSTTPVSQHPAVYYAHLAAGRGIAHLNTPSKVYEVPVAATGNVQSEVKPLLPLKSGNLNEIFHTMWFV